MSNRRTLMLGNEAIARGLMESGCTMATSYPGTPASEILSSLVSWNKTCSYPIHIQWAINEKVAFEIAYAGSIAGTRTAVSMKQVGLNVAYDPFMSAAYMGTSGGFVVISADDPGPHSSQTEQDSRLMAMAAKVPVLDPSSPRHAKEMVLLAYDLSEKFKIPVMVRPTTRVCHARQDVPVAQPALIERTMPFTRNPERWAATPRYRSVLHKELHEKLQRISAYPKTAPKRLNRGAQGRKAVVASGVALAHATEIMKELDLWTALPLYHVLQPYPLHRKFIAHLMDSYEEILVLEETMPVIEMQIAERRLVKGKLDHWVPQVGELLPETIQEVLGSFSGLASGPAGRALPASRRPTLCAGCPHRAAFFGIKKAVPHGVYASDIGCYTLGLNMGAVDTVLCMGASIGMASGFYHAFKGRRHPPNIVATIGDSTFFHAGIPPMIDAVVQRAAFVVVILDNGTTAMTGNQPTPASGFGAAGEALGSIRIEDVVRGCGVTFCRVVDPFDLKTFVAVVRNAVEHCRAHGPAVVIARHPCPLAGTTDTGSPTVEVEVDGRCDGCGYCVNQFECPALVFHKKEKRVRIDPTVCRQCGVCLDVCPKGNILSRTPAD